MYQQARVYQGYGVASQPADYYQDKKSFYNQNPSETPSYAHSQYFQNYQCEEHMNEPITNYCSSLECLKPLCPECIDAHYKFHLQNQTQAEVESIKNVKNNCSKKLKAAITSLNQEMEKAEFQYLINPDQMIQEGLQKLRKAKDMIFQIVQQYFDSLEDTFKKQVNTNVLKSGDFNAIFEKIRGLIQELENLNTNLDTQNSIQTINKICRLDLKSLMDKYRTEIHKVIDSKDLDPIDVSVQEQSLKMLRSQLESIVQVVKVNSEYHDHDTVSNKEPLQPQFAAKGQGIYSHPIAQKQPMQQNFYEQNQLALVQEGPGQQFPLPLNIQQSQQLQPNQSGYLGQMPTTQQNQPIMQIQNQNIPISFADYFDPNNFDNCQLHFFLSEDTKHKLYFTNLKSKSKQFATVDLNINFTIPFFHKSIVTPAGDIYLTGGRNPDGTKSKVIYQYNPLEQNLVMVAEMSVPRSSHGICYCNNAIYVVGGFTDNQKMTNTCERYNILTKKCELLTGMNNSASSICCCSFNNKFIFKFGGIGENRLLSNIIERFDIQMNKWFVVDPQISPYENPKNFQLLSTSCCAQITPNDILVFGGYNDQNQGSKLTFVLSVNEKDPNAAMIKCINWKPLMEAEGFWNNTAVVMDNQVFALQNVPCYNTNNCLENDRLIISFNGKDWMQHK